MDESAIPSSEGKKPLGVKYSIAALAGVAAIGLGGCNKAEEAAEPTKAVVESGGVTISRVDEPKSPIVNDRKTWTRIEVKLTDDQIAALAEQGVKTDKLAITTYDLNRFAGEMNN